LLSDKQDKDGRKALIESSLGAHVGTVVLDHPPQNFLDVPLLQALADAVDRLDGDAGCRAIVLASAGRSFSAGADFGAVPDGGDMIDSGLFYAQAMRLFRGRKPLVAAVQGAAIGAGAGLALACDFRIAGPRARFGFDFNRLGIHPGFGISLTLPRLVGPQHAARLLYAGRRVPAEEALAIGLTDELVPEDEVLPRAQALAAEFALSAPDAVQTTRDTLRQGLAEAVAARSARELAVQRPQFRSRDFAEGVSAAAARRPPIFTGE